MSGGPPGQFAIAPNAANDPYARILGNRSAFRVAPYPTPHPLALHSQYGPQLSAAPAATRTVRRSQILSADQPPQDSLRVRITYHPSEDEEELGFWSSAGFQGLPWRSASAHQADTTSHHVAAPVTPPKNSSFSLRPPPGNTQKNNPRGSASASGAPASAALSPQEPSTPLVPSGPLADTSQAGSNTIALRHQIYGPRLAQMPTGQLASKGPPALL